MKYLILIGDGMGDYPREDLGGKTLLEAANTPNMDWLAQHGRGGMMQTVPPSMEPGSDVANMEIMGYDTTKAFTGRAVFEALSMGRRLGRDDVAFRANLVTIEDGRMADYSAGHITTEEARDLIGLLDAKLGTEELQLFPGVSYRHLMVWKGGIPTMKTTPPHDITGQEIAPWLPSGDGAEQLLSLMNQSRAVLADALVNRKRVASGKLPATSLWFWGQGRALELPSIEERFGLRGGVISAVDLIKGIGVAVGLTPIFVPGATGYIDTNFSGKADAAIAGLVDKDLIYVHVEAPDEMGHNGDLALKIKAIELFDEKVVGPALEEFRHRKDLVVLVTCDHRTPVVRRTHTREPVPFAFVAPDAAPDDMRAFSERDAEEHGGLPLIQGHELFPLLFGDTITR